MKRIILAALITGLCPALAASAQTGADAAADSVTVVHQDRSLELLVPRPELGHELRVQSPDGTLAIEQFAPGEVPVWWHDDTGAMSEGLYTYELRSIDPVAPLRETGGAPESVEGMRHGSLASGYFSVRNGAIIRPDRAEDGGYYQKSVTTKDQVFNDDLIVTGSTCIGLDCVNGEVFDFDTVRLKENNLRIDFTDTSVSGGFPTEDWQLVANESDNGGINAFWIQADGPTGSGDRIFLVEAGAPSNSLYVDNTGDIGIGTAAPVLDLHISTGNTPGQRLEQNASGGFGVQTWDIAGNEANFFVRDVTNGSLLPFRIRPGAPTSSIDISANGNVGVGTASPGKQLHVQSASADTLGQNNTMLRVENTSSTQGARRMIELTNNGSPLLVYRDTARGTVWNMSPIGNRFVISQSGTGAQEFEMDNSGNLTIQGSLTQNSSRSSKDQFSAIDADTVLAKLDRLSIEEWSYKHTPDARHVSPMADSFHAIFGLGPKDGIAPTDLAGVALAAAKALKQQNESLMSENRELRERIEAIESSLELDKE